MVPSNHPYSPRVTGQILHICCSWVAPVGIGQNSGNDWWQGREWLVAALGMAGHPAHPQGCGKGQTKCELGITLSL